MADREMFPQWKLILQKTKFKVLVILLIITAIGFGFSSILADSCTVKHVGLLDQIKKYENSLDPELCMDIVDKIDLFNESCTPKLETIDCG